MLKMLTLSKQKTISVIFLTIAAIMLISAVFKISSSDSNIKFVDLEEQKARQESDIKQELKKHIDELKKVNMFAPYQKPQPPSKVEGIFGQKAYFGEKGYKVGEKVPPGAEITEITCTYVKLKFDGREIKLYPTNAYIPPKLSSSTPKKAKTKPSAQKNQVQANPQAATMPTTVSSDDDLSWLDIPAHLKEMVRKMFAQATPEQKEKAKKEWENMSAEKKEEAIEHLQKQYDRMNG